MDPGVEYERLLALFERTRAEHARAVALGDPQQVILEQIMQRIWANLSRVRRLAMRNARNL